MKNKFEVFPSMIVAVFLTMIIAMFAFTRAARSTTNDNKIGGLPAPSPRSTDGGPIGFDSGFITIGDDQTMRMTFSAGGDSGSLIVSNDSFMQVGCDGGVCNHTVSSHARLGPFTLVPGEALSIDVPANGGSGMREMVSSNIKNLRVLAQILDSQGHVVVAFTVDAAPPDTNG